MVPRYTRPAMAAIWSPVNRYRLWFAIEAAAADGMAAVGTIPAMRPPSAIRAKGQPMLDADGPTPIIDRIDAIEAETRHDVIAFLTWLAEGVGAESRFVHQGMTSSDVLDTCLSLQLTQAADLLLADLDQVLAALRRRARRAQAHAHHRPQPRHPRGTDLVRAQARRALCRVRPQPHCGCWQRGRRWRSAPSPAPSAPTPTSTRAWRSMSQRSLGLAVEPVSTQVIARDRHAQFFCTLAVIASGVERLSIEVRHLQRSEVREAEEFFHAGQKGSSAMPHKRNPVLSENLTGLARIVRAAAVPALENVALWHERDISHSSVERVIGPDATLALDFALDRGWLA